MFLDDSCQKKFRKTPDGAIGPANFILLYLINMGISQRHLVKREDATESIKKDFIKSILRQIESYAGLKPKCLKHRKGPVKN